MQFPPLFFFFFFNDTATTEIYTLSLHDALPIWLRILCAVLPRSNRKGCGNESMDHQVGDDRRDVGCRRLRSEEHTSELQSHSDLVCRLLLEKKKKQYNPTCNTISEHFASKCHL